MPPKCSGFERAAYGLIHSWSIIRVLGPLIVVAVAKNEKDIECVRSRPVMWLLSRYCCA